MTYFLTMNSVLPSDKLVIAARESMLFFFVSYKSSSFDVANSMVASAPADNFVQSMDIQVRVSIVDLMHVRCRLGYSI